jgi:nucleoside-diphosphate-sugar epimerase
VAINKAILLTGANGFLGSILWNKLKLSHTIVTLGKSDGNDITADIRKPIAGINHPVDWVIHTAGKAHVIPKTEKEIQEFFDVNFEGTKNLCAALSKKLPQAFIFISTVAVYGADSGEMINENSPLNGKSPYAVSKIKAEEWLDTWASENNVKLAILRLPLVVGPHPPGNLGDMIRGIRSGKYLSIKRSDAHKSMVWAEDIAAIIDNLAATGGTYNITDGVNPSFNELEICISGALGKKPPFGISIGAAKLIGAVGDILGKKSPVNTSKINKITSTLTFDDTKARTLINWAPSSVLEKLPSIV